MVRVCVSIYMCWLLVEEGGGGMKLSPMALVPLLCDLAFKAQRGLGNWDFNLQVYLPTYHATADL